MRLRRKVRITLTEERVVSAIAGGAADGAGGGQVVVAWCLRCATSAAMLTPEQAAAQAGVSARQIFRWLEAGLLHFVEADGPWPLVCRPSLFAAARRETGAALPVELNGEQGR